MSDIFSEETPTPNPTDLDNWIGPGKKYADTDAALRALPHAQQHITQLEQEAAKLREQVTAMESQTAQNNTDNTQKIIDAVKSISTQQNNEASTAPAIDAEAIQQMVANGIQQHVSESTAQGNLTKATNELIGIHGDAAKATAALQQKASELGMTVSALKELGKQSPDALVHFFKKPESAPAPVAGNPTPAVTTTTLNSENIKPYTKAYYDKMRRDNPSQFYKADIQREREQKLAELGDAFYQ